MAINVIISKHIKSHKLQEIALKAVSGPSNLINEDEGEVSFHHHHHHQESSAHGPLKLITLEDLAKADQSLLQPDGDDDDADGIVTTAADGGNWSDSDTTTDSPPTSRQGTAEGATAAAATAVTGTALRLGTSDMFVSSSTITKLAQTTTRADQGRWSDTESVCSVQSTPRRELTDPLHPEPTKNLLLDWEDSDNDDLPLPQRSVGHHRSNSITSSVSSQSFPRLKRSKSETRTMVSDNSMFEISDNLRNHLYACQRAHVALMKDWEGPKSR